MNGIYEKHAYISAYVNEVEIRVFCKYAVKEGAKKAPGLMNTHGWMGGPSIDMQYVKDGWAVISHDYSGLVPPWKLHQVSQGNGPWLYGCQKAGLFPDL